MLVRYRAGERWYLHETELQAEAALTAKERMEEIDPWAVPINTYCVQKCDEPISTVDILSSALFLAIDKQDYKHSLRVGKIMRRLGYRQISTRKGEVVFTTWRKQN